MATISTPKALHIYTTFDDSNMNEIQHLNNNIIENPVTATVTTRSKSTSQKEITRRHVFPKTIHTNTVTSSSDKTQFAKNEKRETIIRKDPIGIHFTKVPKIFKNKISNVDVNYTKQFNKIGTTVNVEHFVIKSDRELKSATKDNEDNVHIIRKNIHKDKIYMDERHVRDLFLEKQRTISNLLRDDRGDDIVLNGTSSFIDIWRNTTTKSYNASTLNFTTFQKAQNYDFNSLNFTSTYLTTPFIERLSDSHGIIKQTGEITDKNILRQSTQTTLTEDTSMKLKMFNKTLLFNTAKENDASTKNNKHELSKNKTSLDKNSTILTTFRNYYNFITSTNLNETKQSNNSNTERSSSRLLKPTDGYTEEYSITYSPIESNNATFTTQMAHVTPINYFTTTTKYMENNEIPQNGKVKLIEQNTNINVLTRAKKIAEPSHIGSYLANKDFMTAWGITNIQQPIYSTKSTLKIDQKIDFKGNNGTDTKLFFTTTTTKPSTNTYREGSSTTLSRFTQKQGLRINNIHSMQTMTMRRYPTKPVNITFFTKTFQHVSGTKRIDKLEFDKLVSTVSTLPDTQGNNMSYLKNTTTTHKSITKSLNNLDFIESSTNIARSTKTNTLKTGTDNFHESQINLDINSLKPLRFTKTIPTTVSYKEIIKRTRVITNNLQNSTKTSEINQMSSALPKLSTTEKLFHFVTRNKSGNNVLPNLIQDNQENMYQKYDNLKISEHYTSWPYNVTRNNNEYQKKERNSHIIYKINVTTNDYTNETYNANTVLMETTIAKNLSSNLNSYRGQHSSVIIPKRDTTVAVKKRINITTTTSSVIPEWRNGKKAISSDTGIISQIDKPIILTNKDNRSVTNTNITKDKNQNSFLSLHMKKLTSNEETENNVALHNTHAQKTVSQTIRYNKDVNTHITTALYNKSSYNTIKYNYSISKPSLNYTNMITIGDFYTTVADTLNDNNKINYDTDKPVQFTKMKKTVLLKFSTSTKSYYNVKEGLSDQSVKPKINNSLTISRHIENDNKNKTGTEKINQNINLSSKSTSSEVKMKRSIKNVSGLNDSFPTTMMKHVNISYDLENSTVVLEPNRFTQKGQSNLERKYFNSTTNILIPPRAKFNEIIVNHFKHPPGKINNHTNHKTERDTKVSVSDSNINQRIFTYNTNVQTTNQSNNSSKHKYTDSENVTHRTIQNVTHSKLKVIDNSNNDLFLNQRRSSYLANDINTKNTNVYFKSKYSTNSAITFNKITFENDSHHKTVNILDQHDNSHISTTSLNKYRAKLNSTNKLSNKIDSIKFSNSTVVPPHHISTTLLKSIPLEEIKLLESNNATEKYLPSKRVKVNNDMRVTEDGKRSFTSRSDLSEIDHHTTRPSTNNSRTSNEVKFENNSHYKMFTKIDGHENSYINTTPLNINQASLSFPNILSNNINSIQLNTRKVVPPHQIKLKSMPIEENKLLKSNNITEKCLSLKKGEIDDGLIIVNDGKRIFPKRADLSEIDSQPIRLSTNNPSTGKEMNYNIISTILKSSTPPTTDNLENNPQKLQNTIEHSLFNTIKKTTKIHVTQKDGTFLFIYQNRTENPITEKIPTTALQNISYKTTDIKTKRSTVQSADLLKQNVTTHSQAGIINFSQPLHTDATSYIPGLKLPHSSIILNSTLPYSELPISLISEQDKQSPTSVSHDLEKKGPWVIRAMKYNVNTPSYRGTEPINNLSVAQKTRNVTYSSKNPKLPIFSPITVQHWFKSNVPHTTTDKSITDIFVRGTYDKTYITTMSNDELKSKILTKKVKNPLLPVSLEWKSKRDLILFNTNSNKMTHGLEIKQEFTTDSIIQNNTIGDKHFQQHSKLESINLTRTENYKSNIVKNTLPSLLKNKDGILKNFTKNSKESTYFNKRYTTISPIYKTTKIHAGISKKYIESDQLQLLHTITTTQRLPAPLPSEFSLKNLTLQKISHNYLTTPSKEIQNKTTQSIELIKVVSVLTTSNFPLITEKYNNIKHVIRSPKIVIDNKSNALIRNCNKSDIQNLAINFNQHNSSSVKRQLNSLLTINSTDVDNKKSITRFKIYAFSHETKNEELIKDTDITSRRMSSQSYVKELFQNKINNRTISHKFTTYKPILRHILNLRKSTITNLNNNNFKINPTYTYKNNLDTKNMHNTTNIFTETEKYNPIVQHYTTETYNLKQNLASKQQKTYKHTEKIINNDFKLKLIKDTKVNKIIKNKSLLITDNIHLNGQRKDKFNKSKVKKVQTISEKPKETQQVTQRSTLTTFKRIKPIKYNTYTPTKDDLDIPINPFSNTLKTKKKASIVQKLNVHKNLQKYKSINYHPTHFNVTKNTKNPHKLRTSTPSIQRNKPQHEIHSNFRKAETNSDTLLDPFGKTNLYPIKMIPAQTQRKIMKRIRIGNKNQEAIHSHNFYSQRRFATQKNIYKDIPVLHRQPQQNEFHVTSEPKRHLHNSESEEMKQNKQGKEYFRPKPLLLSHEDFYKEDFQNHHKRGFSWRDKVTFVREAMIPPVTEQVEKASVIERPEYSQPLPPLSKPKFLRDRIDSIRNYLNMVDMKPTRKPVNYFMKSASSNSEDQSQESAKFYIMREGWVNHQTTTTTTVPKHKRRSRRTLFFLSPTVPYNKYF